MTYKVFVDDNYHFMDESERYALGAYPTYELAVAACKRIVDEFFTNYDMDHMSAEEMFSGYVSYGESPFIAPEPDPDHFFSARAYAKQRCEEIAKQGK